MVSCLVLVVAHRVSIMGSFILAHECSSYGSWASLLPGVWDLSSLTGGQTHVSCIARWIPNPWTTREVPVLLIGQSWWGVYFLFSSCSSPEQMEKVLNAFSDGQLQSRNRSKFCSSRTGADCSVLGNHVFLFKGRSPSLPAGFYAIRIEERFCHFWSLIVSLLVHIVFYWEIFKF